LFGALHIGLDSWLASLAVLVRLVQLSTVDVSRASIAGGHIS
jgi:hypothetical protein